MARIRQVAVLFPLARAHLTRLLRGITDYAGQHADWTFHVSPEQPNASIRVLSGWRGDGALAMVNRAADAKVARGLDMPVVNLSAALREAGLPRVTVDHCAVGRLAAEHLLERGFRRFGYYGLRRVWYAQQRGRGFISALAERGFACAKMQDNSSLTTGRAWRDSHDLLRNWLRTLEPPVGVLAAHDYRAAMVIDACRELGLRVPDDVAVLGVNNETVICEFCGVPISSVSRNDHKVGYEAAALLDRLMQGRSAPVDEILVPPDEVVLRRSSDVMAVDDPAVETAAKYIRERLAEDIDIDQLARLVSLSRRWLQHRFKKCLGMTLHEFICRERVERAKQLLISQRKTRLGQIAQACGFSETRQMRKAFERIEGATPTQLRRDKASGGNDLTVSEGDSLIFPTGKS